MSKMNFSELSLRVAQRCNDVTTKGRLAAGRFVNQIIETMAEERDWSFFKIRDDSLVLTADLATPYDLNTDFDRVSKVFTVDTQGEFFVIDPADDEEYFRRVNESRSGITRLYRFFGQDATNQKPRMQFGPPPSSTFLALYGSTVTIEEYQDVPTLVAAADYPLFPPRFHKIIEWGASWLMGMDHKDARANQWRVIYDDLLGKKMLQDERLLNAPIVVGPTAAATMRPWEVRESGAMNDYGS